MTNDDQDDNAPREHLVTNSEKHAHYAHYQPGTPAVVADPVEQDLQLRVQSLEDSRRAWRWIAGIGLPVLLTSVVVVMLWLVDRVSTSERAAGRSEATTESILFRLNLLETYVHELLRHAGLDSKPISITQSLGDAAPMSCGGGCTTSPECQGTGSCNYCYQGKCSAVLPAEPPRDAGADTSGGMTDPIASEPSKGPRHDLVSNP